MILMYFGTFLRTPLPYLATSFALFLNFTKIIAIIVSNTKDYDKNYSETNDNLPQLTNHIYSQCVCYQIMKQFFKELCEKIVIQDPSIRFVGIADQDGTLEADAERKGLKAIFSPDQRAEYAITAANRQATRLRWEYLLGKISFATSHYEKLIRATIPIADENRRLSHVVLVSFDPQAKADEIIIKKIIPLIRQNMKNFA